MFSQACARVSTAQRFIGVRYGGDEAVRLGHSSRSRHRLVTRWLLRLLHGSAANPPGLLPVTRAEADKLAAVLELDVDDIAICHACLSTVSFALDFGNEHKVAGSITRVAADLRAEGLALPVQSALERARERGVANAGEAIAAVGREGSMSRVVRVIVRRLAADLSARAEGDLFRMGWQPWPPGIRCV